MVYYFLKFEFFYEETLAGLWYLINIPKNDSMKGLHKPFFLENARKFPYFFYGFDDFNVGY